MPEISLHDWNLFVQAQPNLHLLQTGEWGELKAGFGWEVVRLVAGGIGTQVLFRKLPLGFTVGYIPKPHFNLEDILNDNPFWAELDSICLKHRAIFCKLEPDDWEGDTMLTMPGHWTRAQYNIQPPRTIVVDIHGKEDEILAHMKQKCRYNIRLAEKKGVIVRVWENIEGFYRMMRETGGRDGFGVHSLEYYRRAYQLFHQNDMCELLVAEYDGNPLAAIMVFAVGSRSWYVYGASNERDRNRMPAYLVQWEAIRWAKAHGCSEYDLWGIPDEDESVLEAEFETRSDGLWGVYRFKRGFGGELKRAAQALDRVYNPWLYQLYLRRMSGRESI